MDTKELKEYLGIVVDMEKNIYLQEATMAQLSREAQCLGYAQSFKCPTPPQEEKSYRSVAALIGCGILALGVTLFICGTKLSFLSGLLVCILGIAIFLGGLQFFVSVVFEDIGSDRRREEQYQEEVARYPRLKQEYEQNVAADKERVAAEIIRKQVLLTVLTELQAQHSASVQTREKIYEKNIIFPKYRNFIMVCSLYEYFCSGRCSQLEGHEGAYNILEMEIRLDRILTKLDQVISHLDTIQQNQFMIYSAIQESNQLSTQILESTHHMADKIQTLNVQASELNTQMAAMQETSMLTAYYTERTQKELAYMKRMNFLTV